MMPTLCFNGWFVGDPVPPRSVVCVKGLEAHIRLGDVEWKVQLPDFGFGKELVHFPRRCAF